MESGASGLSQRCCLEFVTRALSPSVFTFACGISLSGVVPSPGDPQLEFCPIFKCHILCEAVVVGPDFCLLQTILSRDLVCLTVFCLLSVLLPVCLSSDLQALGGKFGLYSFLCSPQTLAFYSAVFSF